MHAALNSLTLTDVRSYTRAELAPAAGVVVLFGPNGAGKTNVLEAISLLSPGKGLRGAAVSEIGRRPPESSAGRAWAVSAVVRHGDDERRIGTGLEAGSSRRTVRLDGETVAPGRLLDLLRPVWLIPAHDRLFLEAASERRRFLDRLVFADTPGHATVAAAYERAQRERLRLLTDGPDDPAWLGALEARMAEAGARLTTARLATLEALQAEIDSRADRPFPLADLSLSVSDADQDSLRAGLASGRGRDAATGRTLSPGPHRSDLLVIHRGRGRPAAEGSTGEQKALLLNLILAQAARLSRVADAPAPILLLDEIAAHLDENRRAALYEELLTLNLQAFLTGADRTLFAALEGRAQFVRVEGGALNVAP